VTFVADFAGAIVVEAATYGYPNGAHNNKPKAIGLHTPEEPPDATPSTPYYFHNLTGRNASTTYFAAWTGLIFQCVPEDEGAYGNALEGKPPPPWSDGTNLNLQTISIEIEGYAATIHQTMPRGSPQWVSLVRLMADVCRRRPNVNIDFTFGHFAVSIYRSDPGQLNIGALVADTKTLIVGLEDDFMAALTPDEQQELLTKTRRIHDRTEDIWHILFDQTIGAEDDPRRLMRVSFEVNENHKILFDDLSNDQPTDKRRLIGIGEMVKNIDAGK
jgi:hypothetical protein